MRRFLAENAKVLLWALIVVACVIYAAEKPLNFIYTEF
jgi:hypothetical protein